MKRTVLILVLATALLTIHPASAAADATAFVGFSPTVATRSATGFSIGVSLIVVGFEFEYAHLNDNATSAAPGVSSGMFNALIMTPTKTQLYVTAGGGIYHESLAGTGNTNVGLNFGGGLKIPLAGPFRVRVDYRVMKLNSSLVSKPLQRVYVGANIMF